MLHEKSRHRLQYYIDNNPPFHPPPPKIKFNKGSDCFTMDIFNRILDKLRTLMEGKLSNKKNTNSWTELLFIVKI